MTAQQLHPAPQSLSGLRIARLPEIFLPSWTLPEVCTSQSRSSTVEVGSVQRDWCNASLLVFTFQQASKNHIAARISNVLWSFASFQHAGSCRARPSCKIGPAVPPLQPTCHVCHQHNIPVLLAVANKYRGRGTCAHGPVLMLPCFASAMQRLNGRTAMLGFVTGHCACSSLKEQIPAAEQFSNDVGGVLCCKTLAVTCRPWPPSFPNFVSGSSLEVGGEQRPAAWIPDG